MSGIGGWGDPSDVACISHLSGVEAMPFRVVLPACCASVTGRCVEASANSGEGVLYENTQHGCRTGTLSIAADVVSADIEPHRSRCFLANEQPFVLDK